MGGEEMENRGGDTGGRGEERRVDERRGEGLSEVLGLGMSDAFIRVRAAPGKRLLGSEAPLFRPLFPPFATLPPFFFPFFFGV